MGRAEVRWAVTWAAVVMAITCLPYLYAAAHTPPGTTFSGLLFAADDHCVYLSWEQQAAQGHFFMRNLFTGEAQRGIYISLLSWLVGSLARITGLPLILVHHGARVLFGMLALVLAYAFSARFTRDVPTRRAAFWFTAFSAGLGWLLPWTMDARTEVVERLQPEANTFLSLYTNGLFCAALSMMLGIFLLLLSAEEASGRRRWTRLVGAGLLGLLLGNIHSYDVITVVGVWIAYLLVRAVAERGLPLRALTDALVAGVVALPSTAYQYYLYRTEPVFRMRADDKFLSAPLTGYLLAYGLVLLLAIGGAVWLARTASRSGEPLGQRFFPITWAVAGFAIPYLPFAFQRKLVLGLHLPLAFLAGVAAVAIARAVIASRTRTAEADRRRSHGTAAETPSARLTWAQAAIVTGLLLVTIPTGLRFVRQDLTQAWEKSSDLNLLPPFLPQADLDAIHWARENLPKDGLIFCSTVAGRLFPALAARPVYVGHWSETPHANERMMETAMFYRTPNASSEERRQFLKARGIRYVYQGSTERRIGPTDLARDPLFHPVYSNDGVAIYEMKIQLAGGVP